VNNKEQKMSLTLKDSILNKLLEVEDELQKTTCEGDSFSQASDDYEDWAVEIRSSLEDLIEKIGYYIDE
jgi:hypothetical protein